MKKKGFIFLFLFTLSFTVADAQCIDLMDFNCNVSGQNPQGSLIYDGTFLYGMSQTGGTYSKGTIFKLMPDGSGYAKLWDFTGAEDDGNNPLGSLLFDGTYLYGMTMYGGGDDQGIVFKIKPDGSGFTKTFNFSNMANGQFPMGSLISDGTYLYGMTNTGGAYYRGTIFRLKPDGSGFKRLYDFYGPPNGQLPNGSLIYDGTFMYGMTTGGGTHSMGVLFKIKPDGSGYSKLLDFAGATNGQLPNGSLVTDSIFLYGTTQLGGTNNKGTVFKIMPDGSGFETLLCFDGDSTGSEPIGSLMYNKTFLYGMTNKGGKNNMGTLFRIKTDGSNFTRLWDFSGAPDDGSNPCLNSLIMAGSNLYGMTFRGGKNDNGEVFRYSLNAGITELDKNTGLCIYPNPANEIITIETGLSDKKGEISIYDISGKPRMLLPFKGNNTKLNINCLPKGFYIIKLTRDGSILTAKFAKD